MKKRSFSISNIGSASLIMTFIVMCLVVFAILSLSESASENRYSKQLADHTDAYYKASNEATLILSRIDGMLVDEASLASGDDYFEAVKDAIGTLNLDADPDLSAYDDHLVSFHLPIDNRHELLVTLEILDPSGGDDTYVAIRAWQKSGTTTWSGDNKINVM